MNKEDMQLDYCPVKGTDHTHTHTTLWAVFILQPVIISPSAHCSPVTAGITVAFTLLILSICYYSLLPLLVYHYNLWLVSYHQFVYPTGKIPQDFCSIAALLKWRERMIRELVSADQPASLALLPEPAAPPILSKYPTARLRQAEPSGQFYLPPIFPQAGESSHDYLCPWLMGHL